MGTFLKNLTIKIHKTVISSTFNNNVNLFLNAAYSRPSGPVTEDEIIRTLRKNFPGATSISVEDTSGGCGAMFNVAIESSEFKGLPIMKQHKLIYEALKEQIKLIHGIHLETYTPKG